MGVLFGRYVSLMDDYHALDAAFAWLDCESLLRAGAVCRRWRERAALPQAWRPHVTVVGWTRGMDPREAHLASMRMRGRWRRGRGIAVTELAACGDLLHADGDWLALTCRRVVLGEDGLGASDAVRLCDIGGARTLAVLPSRTPHEPTDAVLSRELGRCAVIGTAWHAPTVCDVWAPVAARGGRWEAVYGIPCDGYDGAHWQRDGQLVCCRRRGVMPAATVEWYDVTAGAALPVSRVEHEAMGTDVAFVRVGDLDLLAAGETLHALDTRAPALAPLMTFRSAFGTHTVFSNHAALGDGRLLATSASNPGGVRAGVELWDVRAGRRDAAPVAVLRNPHWCATLCGTARGTVLGSAYVPCGGHPADPMPCGDCTQSLAEWDAARGTVETLLAADGNQRRCIRRFVWADERRTVVYLYGSSLFLLDAADAAAEHAHPTSAFV